MELKKNDDLNQNPQGGAPAGNYYGQRDMMNSNYGNMAGGTQGQFGGPNPGQPNPAPASPYSQPQGAYNQAPNPSYGGGFNGGNPYPQRGQSSFDGGATTIQQKSGINPMVIIIPILIVLGIIGYSQFKRIFGQSTYIPGKLEGDTFTNEYFGFKADFKGWTLTGYPGNAETEITALKDNQPVNELQASKDMGTSAFSFDVKKTPYNIKESGADFTKMIEAYQEEYKKTVRAQGFEVESLKQEKMTVAGKTCDGYIISGKLTAGGRTMKIYAAQYFMLKGTYLSVFTGVSTSEGGAKSTISKHVEQYHTAD